MIHLALRVIIAMVMILSSVSFGGTYSGGTGEPNNPYQIASKADLLALGATTADYGKCFILTDDIDLDPCLPGGQVFTTAIIAPDTVAGNDRFNGTLFTGTFDGNGHKIIDVTINGGSNSYLGLFGYTNTSGSIKNLGLENCSVSGTSPYVGGMVGYNYGGSIRNCYSMGVVSGSSSVGGLVGYSQGGNISNCYSTGCSGAYAVGGLVGTSDSSIIINCHSAGAVLGNIFVGGLVGYNNNRASIHDCYSTGSASGSSGIGGLAGNNDIESIISNCYSTGAVSGSFSVGGLTGTNYCGSTVHNCYSTGEVSGSSSVGGLVGDSISGSVVDSFWDTQTSVQPNSDGGTGLSTLQMKQQASFTAWDFLGEAGNGTADIWRMCTDGVDYPRLSWEFVKGGDFSCPDGVAMDDLLRLGQDWLTTYSQAFYGADANGDSKVTFADFAIFAANWLE